jgi:hypothetical protein
MGEKWSGKQTIVYMALGTALAFLLWLLVVYVLWRALQGAQVAANYWVMVETLSTALTAAAVIGGGIVAYRQLVEGASTRYIDVADRLFDELNSQENVRARGWIFKNLSIEKEILEEMADKIRNGEEFDIGEEKLGEILQAIKNNDGKEYVKQTLNSLDRVAFLTQSGWIPEEIIMPWMNPMIVKSWLRLKSYVEHEREKRKEPDYYEDAGKLGDRCVVWRIDKYGTAVSERSTSTL